MIGPTSENNTYYSRVPDIVIQGRLESDTVDLPHMVRHQREALYQAMLETVGKETTLLICEKYKAATETDMKTSLR